MYIWIHCFQWNLLFNNCYISLSNRGLFFLENLPFFVVKILDIEYIMGGF